MVYYFCMIGFVIVIFCITLKEKYEYSSISILKLRDMIDVHIFMWHMAPTGKHSKD